jgi:flagellar hook-associated protein 1 FlgK
VSDLFNIGRSGITSFRIALTAVSDNVANAETPGFARRTVDLKEAAGGGLGAAMIFSGVKVASVGRAWDEYQAADARLAASYSGRAQVREQWLGAVETALGDPARDVGVLLGNFFNAGVALASQPANRLGRSAMLYALEEAAGSIRTTAQALERVASGIETAAQLETDALNDDLAALTKVNLALRQSEPGRTSRASLEDERDRLIDSISARIDVNVAIGENGTATLTLAQHTGVTLLDPRHRGLVILAPAADGRLTLQLSANGVRSPLPASAGTLAGLVDISASTADKRVALDALAGDFVSEVNNWSAQGIDANGNPGAPLLAITAGAVTIAVLASDPAAIAAASATAENGNLLDMPTLRGTNGAEGRWAAIVAGQAQALASARSEAAAAATRRDNAFGAREEVSGVDLDREAADLMRYQQAYGASAKIIQVARETTQTILDLF